MDTDMLEQYEFRKKKFHTIYMANSVIFLYILYEQICSKVHLNANLALKLKNKLCYFVTEKVHEQFSNVLYGLWFKMSEMALLCSQTEGPLTFSKYMYISL